METSRLARWSIFASCAFMAPAGRAGLGPRSRSLRWVSYFTPEGLRVANSGNHPHTGTCHRDSDTGQNPYESRNIYLGRQSESHTHSIRCVSVIDTEPHCRSYTGNDSFSFLPPPSRVRHRCRCGGGRIDAAPLPNAMRRIGYSGSPSIPEFKAGPRSYDSSSCPKSIHDKGPSSWRLRTLERSRDFCCWGVRSSTQPRPSATTHHFLPLISATSPSHTCGFSVSFTSPP